ncbi:hypothetical protein XELAEV_18028332mg, partial [Xenopus laevis]
DVTSQVTSKVLSFILKSCNLRKTSPVSFKQEGKEATKGCNFMSMYCPAISHKLLLPDIIGQSGGLSLFL